ncbi:hypothetical protein Lepto1548_05720 [Leptospira interrogans serovar Bataviae]|nr:hypothetical protein Lepto1548_05720 [Leptospira interrogans serovar Bataviae]
MLSCSHLQKEGYSEKNLTSVVFQILNYSRHDMYYVVDYLTNPSVEDDDDGPFLEIHEELVKRPEPINWHMGKRFDTDVTVPIEVPVSPRFDYDGPPPDFFDGSISLLSPRLAKILQDNGVNNLDLYEVVLIYTDSGARLKHYAFNITNKASVIDFKKSNIESYDGNYSSDSSIRGFAADEHKIQNLPSIFRLEENVMTVLVHERIKNAIHAAGINSFAFVEPKNWIQL